MFREKKSRTIATYRRLNLGRPPTPISMVGGNPESAISEARRFRFIEGTGAEETGATGFAGTAAVDGRFETPGTLLIRFALN